MPTVSVAPIVVRTTNEPAGAHPHGIVLVTGPAPQAALEDLLTEAGLRAALLDQEAAAAETGLEDAAWSFHVAGVRLTAPVPPGGAARPEPAIATVCAAASASTSAAITMPPSAARRNAIARSIPLPARVTTPTRSS
jgi:hypothetical protein